MSVIINDFSLTGQFQDEEEFFDSLVEETLPMFKIIENLDIDVLSGYETYSLMVTKERNLMKLMGIKGSAEIARLKSLLIAPFWEDDLFSNNQSIYECKYTKKTKAYCLAEAFERNMSVLSFKHPEFQESIISLKKDGFKNEVSNSYNKSILLDILREKSVINAVYYLVEKYELNSSFGLTIGKNYFDELIKEVSLNKEEINIIAEDIEKLIDFTKKGKNPGRLSDTIEGKLKEFRTSLSQKREIRIFYFEVDRNITFLNGFLKKTEKTPTSEIDKAKAIMKKVFK